MFNPMVQSLAPIALLYTRGSASIDGATRFQKLIFLAQMEEDLGEKYEFHEGKYGPYSPTLSSDLRYFEENGYIERNAVTNSAGNEKHVFGLTDEGYTLARKMIDKGSFDAILQSATRTKSKFNNWSLDRLLEYVYGRYPGYITRSELDIERLFDPEADSQFLDQGLSYLGPNPENSLDINSSAEDVFSIE